jgi:Flavin reductase like domain
VITTQTPSGKLEGLTANSFSAPSLDPPLVLWSIRLSAPSLPGFLAASGVAVNVLAADQRMLAAAFATALIHKFADVPFAIGLRGYPVLPGSIRGLRMSDGEHLRGRRPPDLHWPRRSGFVLRRRAARLQPRRVLRPPCATSRRGSGSACTPEAQSSWR